MRAARRALASAIALAWLAAPARAQTHPLDPLTPDEIRSAARVARTDARFAAASFASILLDEPAKADVVAWRPGRAGRGGPPIS